MENNAIIKGTLQEVLGIMDARAYVMIFAFSDDNKSVGEQQGQVMRVLCNKDFMGVYGMYDVVGINVGISVVSILIQKEA